MTMLQPCKELTLSTLDNGSDTISPTSRIVWRNGKHSQAVLGKELIDQYKVGNFYLVLLTEDCPFEEALHIYLFDSNADLVDHLELSAAYHAGIFKLKALHDDGLSFSFFSEEELWQLRCLKSPKWRLPRLFSPVKSSRGFGRAMLVLFQH